MSQGPLAAEPQKRFKVYRNAQDLLLTGCALLYPPAVLPCQLVIVEGAPKAVAKYKSLMLRRIQWGKRALFSADPDAPHEPQEPPDTEGPTCSLIWEGPVLTLECRRGK